MGQNMANPSEMTMGTIREIQGNSTMGNGSFTVPGMTVDQEGNLTFSR